MTAKDREEPTLIFILGLLFGLVNGALLGLLFAPKAGQEIQADVQRFMQGLPSRLNEEIKNPQGKTRGFLTKTQYQLATQVDKVSRAIKAGKLAEAKKREEMASGYDYN
jgi:gas vesicle protein